MKSNTPNAGSIELKKLLHVSEGSSKEKSDRVSYSKVSCLIFNIVKIGSCILTCYNPTQQTRYLGTTKLLLP